MPEYPEDHKDSAENLNPWQNHGQKKDQILWEGSVVCHTLSKTQSVEDF